MNPLNNRIIEFENKVLTTLLFDGSYVLHVVRHGHPCHLYHHISLLHEGSFELFKKDLPIVIHRTLARLRPSFIPLFPRDIKDEKRNEGKKGRTC